MNILDLVSAAVSMRRKNFGYRYHVGAEERIARASGVRYHNSDKSDESLIDILQDEMAKVERPYYSNPSWDGSIG